MHPYGGCHKVVHRATWGNLWNFQSDGPGFSQPLPIVGSLQCRHRNFIDFHQDKATHISDHIQEWHRWKRLIKAYIPPEFLLEWFLKSLLPYISKDVSTSE
jgi:hypothetical protein